MNRKSRTLLAVIAAIAIGFAAWLGHVGYFGGQEYFEIPARPSPSAPAGTVAVLFSGDMGFRIGMGPRIARKLSADGIPVLGVSSLVHFRHERTPAEVRAFVTEAARRALSFTHAGRLILIGQSFGADMLQVGAEGLPPDLRAKVQMVGLVVPGDTVIYRASPAELFDWATPDAKALPTARALTWAPVVCIYGIDEEDSLCPHLGMPNVRRVALPGGHPLHRDADALYAALKAEIDATGTRSAKITKISDMRHILGKHDVAEGHPAPATGRTGR